MRKKKVKTALSRDIKVEQCNNMELAEQNSMGEINTTHGKGEYLCIFSEG
jgi:hypothetical protein